MCICIVLAISSICISSICISSICIVLVISYSASHLVTQYFKLEWVKWVVLETRKVVLRYAPETLSSYYTRISLIWRIAKSQVAFYKYILQLLSIFSSIFKTFANRDDWARVRFLVLPLGSVA